MLADRTVSRVRKMLTWYHSAYKNYFLEYVVKQYHNKSY